MATDSALRLNVRVTPRARQSQLMGIEDGVLVVRLQAPPIEGKANEALCEFVAGALGLRRGAVSVERGEKSRLKVLRIEGVALERVRELLGGREIQQSSEKQTAHSHPARRNSQHAR